MEPIVLRQLEQFVTSYQPDPRILDLGDAFYDAVEPAAFPLVHAEVFSIAAGQGRRAETWPTSNGRRISAGSSPCRDNLPHPLALRYHGHQFRVYNPEIGDGRGFTFAQLRDEKNDETSKPAKHGQEDRMGLPSSA